MKEGFFRVRDILPSFISKQRYKIRYSSRTRHISSVEDIGEERDNSLCPIGRLMGMTFWRSKDSTRKNHRLY